MTHVLGISGLSGGYGNQPVLREIDLTLNENSVTALIGPNGHGKTSLLRAISGLLPQTRGTITFQGRRIDGLPSYARARLGLVHIPQGDLLFKDLSVEENLRAGGYFLDKRQAEFALGAVFELFPNLADQRKQKTSTLSGGERRMVGIGRGLMQRGTLLMIDEPSLGLAPAVIQVIYNAIREIAADGRTVLLVEESPSRIVGMAKQVVLLDDGQVLWRGSVPQMRENQQLLDTYLGEVRA
jgi:branched-chain amino acid transport system ATP-binding protein